MTRDVNNPSTHGPSPSRLIFLFFFCFRFLFLFLFSAFVSFVLHFSSFLHLIIVFLSSSPSLHLFVSSRIDVSNLLRYVDRRHSQLLPVDPPSLAGRSPAVGCHQWRRQGASKSWTRLDGPMTTSSNRPFLQRITSKMPPFQSCRLRGILVAIMAVPSHLSFPSSAEE